MNDPGYSPIRIQGNPDSGDFVENFQIINNTFVHPYGIGSTAVVLNHVRNAVIKNNIFYDYGISMYSYIYQESHVQNLDSGYNCIFKSDGEPPSGGPFHDDLWMVDPGFVDLEGLDFRLKGSSSLIDKGINLSEVGDDYVGTKRPQGLRHDIGAYEFFTAVPAPRNLRVIGE